MENYLKSCQTEFWQKVLGEETEYLLTSLKNRKKILSVGCGPATIEKEMKKKNFDVTGLDVSQEALNEAQYSIRTVAGSAEKMEFGNATFDAVIYVASLQFINDYKKALQETLRVLKPNGKLVLMLLNPKSEFFGTKKNQKNSYVKKIKHPYLTPIKKFTQKNFTVNKTKYFLGIKNKKTFDTQNPRLAALCIIEGRKPKKNKKEPRG
jgi:ubiquinone/menaquinone biosynthesis C-methylase UbiE